MRRLVPTLAPYGDSCPIYATKWVADARRCIAKQTPTCGGTRLRIVGPVTGTPNKRSTNVAFSAARREIFTPLPWHARCANEATSPRRAPLGELTAGAGVSPFSTGHNFASRRDASARNKGLLELARLNSIGPLTHSLHATTSFSHPSVTGPIPYRREERPRSTSTWRPQRGQNPGHGNLYFAVGARGYRGLWRGRCSFRRDNGHGLDKRAFRIGKYALRASRRSPQRLATRSEKR